MLKHLALILSLLLLPLDSSVITSYFVIVRLPEPSAKTQLSAQFRLLYEEGPGYEPLWNCKDGLTPITYNDTGRLVKAKNMDLTEDSRVECLGLVVRVVVGRHVKVWQGELSPCQEGFMTHTKQLERNPPGGSTSEIFELVPATEFSVFSVEPTEPCAKQNISYIPRPSLQFHHSSDDVITRCGVVLDSDLASITCNMTISTDSDDVVAMSAGATQISVPKLVRQIGYRVIFCRSECRIRSDIAGSDRVVRHDINITYHGGEGSVSNESEIETVVTANPIDPKLLLLILGILSGMLLLSLITTIFFFNLARSLKRRLQKTIDYPLCHPPPSSLRSTSRHLHHSPREYRTHHSCPTHRHSLHPGGFSPPQYSRVHRITNECHHYNTVSLQLDSGRGDSVRSSERILRDLTPVYQKLRASEQYDDNIDV